MLSQPISTHGMIAHFCSGQWICRTCTCMIELWTVHYVYVQMVYLVWKMNEHILRFARHVHCNYIVLLQLCAISTAVKLRNKSKIDFRCKLGRAVKLYGHHIASVNMRSIMLAFGMLYCSCATYHIIDIRYSIFNTYL